MKTDVNKKIEDILKEEYTPSSAAKGLFPTFSKSDN